MSKVTYPCFWIGRDHRGEWRWMYYAPNGEEVAVATEGYFNRENCYRDIERMKACADAPVFYTAGPRRGRRRSGRLVAAARRAAHNQVSSRT
jgi:uncharacterized protein YegP (UPF0339 family)